MEQLLRIELAIYNQTTTLARSVFVAIMPQWARFS